MAGIGDILSGLAQATGPIARGATKGLLAAREQEAEERERESRLRLEALRAALLESRVDAAQAPEPVDFDIFEHGGQQYRFNPRTGEAELVPGLSPVSPAEPTVDITRDTGQGTISTEVPLSRFGDVSSQLPPMTPEEPEAPGSPIAAAKPLRGEFAGNPVVKGATNVAQSFQRVLESAKDPSAAGDLALIFNYMKILDPNSVVRESEFANAAASGSFGARVQAAFNRVQRGERLSEEVRQDFVERARRLAAGQRRLLQREIDRFSRFAQESGVDPSNVVFDPFTGLFDAPGETTLPGGGVPPDTAGVSEDTIRSYIRDRTGGPR